MSAFIALAFHAAHRAGGQRVAWMASVAGFLAALAAAQLPVTDAADRALLAAGCGIAVTGAVVGIGVALGAALALARSADLVPIAAAPIHRATLAVATLVGIALVTATSAAAGTAGTLAATALATSIRRPMPRWALPVGVQGEPGRGRAHWTGGIDRPITVTVLEAHAGGELTVRLAPRIRIAAAQAGPFSELPPHPLQLRYRGTAGWIALPPAAGNPWSRGRLTTTFAPPPGPVVLLVHPTDQGIVIGLDRGDVGVRRPDAPLAAVALRAWAGLVAPLALIALMSGFTSAFCSRGVAAAAGLATAIGLGLAPIARESLAELGRPSGLTAALQPLVGGLLAVIPTPAGGIGSLFGGEDLAWGAVLDSLLAHLPWMAVLAAASWGVVRNRDW